MNLVLDTYMLSSRICRWDTDRTLRCLLGSNNPGGNLWVYQYRGGSSTQPDMAYSPPHSVLLWYLCKYHLDKEPCDRELKKRSLIHMKQANMLLALQLDMNMHYDNHLWRAVN